MHEQDMAIVKALVPIAWADGHFADKERETIDAILDAYRATSAEKDYVREYASQKRTLDDIHVQDLSADDRRVLVQHAVLLCWADGDFSEGESAMVHELAKKLRVPDAEAESLISTASERARGLLKYLR